LAAAVSWLQEGWHAGVGMGPRQHGWCAVEKKCRVGLGSDWATRHAGLAR
jgi:hypothetical protein